jgi:hypothetical protein
MYIDQKTDVFFNFFFLILEIFFRETRKIEKDISFLVHIHLYAKIIKKSSFSCSFTDVD